MNPRVLIVGVGGLGCPASAALAAGAVLEVLLRGDEPLRNVPRSARDEGHDVLSVETRPDGVHRLLIRKSGAR